MHRNASTEFCAIFVHDYKYASVNTLSFQKRILAWYAHYGRHALPWRKTRNPYHILVSEIMLQQTQITRVIPKYKLFLKTFPTPQSLARASTSKLLKIWQGLGYNRRALYMREVARTILSCHYGEFLHDPHMLEQLPGIGRYTARAIITFSFNTPEIFIETNIRRVYIHFFFPRSRKISDKKILPLIKKTLYHNNPRLWYSALMDYGSMLAKTLPKKNPNRKSRHYKKQSKFIGSRREARAHILKYILHSSRATPQSIQRHLAQTPHMQHWSKKTAELIASLAHEKFIIKKGLAWHIAP